PFPPSTPPPHSPPPLATSTPHHHSAHQLRTPTPPTNIAHQHRPPTSPRNIAPQHRPATSPRNFGVRVRPAQGRYEATGRGPGSISCPLAGAHSGASTLMLNARRRLGVEGAQASAWTPSVSAPSSTLRASPPLALRAERAKPAARSSSPRGDRRRQRRSAPCLTACTAAPMSAPAVGTRRHGVLTALQIELIGQRLKARQRLVRRPHGQDQVPSPARPRGRETYRCRGKIEGRHHHPRHRPGEAVAG